MQFHTDRWTKTIGVSPQHLTTISTERQKGRKGGSLRGTQEMLSIGGNESPHLHIRTLSVDMWTVIESRLYPAEVDGELMARGYSHFR